MIDIGLPENPGFWEKIAKFTDVIREFPSQFALSHEEFIVPPLAKTFDVLSTVITDWFDDPDAIEMKALQFAEEIIFMDDAGFCAVPSYLIDKVRFVGTVFRDFAMNIDKETARKRLKIPLQAVVITVAPGGSEIHSEGQAPLFNLLVDSFVDLPFAEKRLIWIVGEPDLSDLQAKAATDSNISIVAPHREFTMNVVASDLLITKGNRNPLLECEALGIPSLSISFGLNPIDDGRIARIKTNTPLIAEALNASVLRERIVGALDPLNHTKYLPKLNIEQSRLLVASLVANRL